ncbi:hypothetical protein D9M70_451360 [compost metagenome]
MYPHAQVAKHEGDQCWQGELTLTGECSRIFGMTGKIAKDLGVQILGKRIEQIGQGHQSQARIEKRSSIGRRPACAKQPAQAGRRPLEPRHLSSVRGANCDFSWRLILGGLAFAPGAHLRPRSAWAPSPPRSKSAAPAKTAPGRIAWSAPARVAQAQRVPRIQSSRASYNTAAHSHPRARCNPATLAAQVVAQLIRAHLELQTAKEQGAGYPLTPGATPTCLAPSGTLRHT